MFAVHVATAVRSSCGWLRNSHAVGHICFVRKPTRSVTDGWQPYQRFVWITPGITDRLLDVNHEFL